MLAKKMSIAAVPASAKPHLSGTPLLARAEWQACWQALDFTQADWAQSLAQYGMPIWSENPDMAPDRAQVDFFWDAATLGQGVHQLSTVYIEIDSHTPHPVSATIAMHRLGQSQVWHWRTELACDWIGSYRYVPVSAEQLRPVSADASVLRAWWQELLRRLAFADPLSLYPAYCSGWGRPSAQLVGPKALRYYVQPTSAKQETQHHIWHSERLQQSYHWHGWDSRLAGTACQTTLPEAEALVLYLDGQSWLNLPGFIGGLQILHQRTEAAKAPVSALHVFLENPGMTERLHDYGANPEFIEALAQELISEIKRQYQTEFKFGVLICGQSLGGLAALYGHLLLPEVFHNCVSLSGSFWWPDAASTSSSASLFTALQRGDFAVPAGRERTLQQRPLWLAAGDLETDMRTLSIEMQQGLQSTGRASSYRDFRGGHDILCWREAFFVALTELLQQP